MSTQEDDERRGIKRSIPISSEDGKADTLEIMPIGAGNEVGRSCIHMKFRGKSVLLDCGIHPAHTGYSALPYFDQLEDIAGIDLLLVSHFHLDHIASLPYFLEKTAFKGKVVMTHPTKAIYRLMLEDYIRVSNLSVEDMIFNEQDLAKSMPKIEAINFHEEDEHKGIRYWCYNAGHVLGAAMFMIEIAGVKVLYTGDYSRQEDRHLMAAEIPEFCPDVLIVESTYGIQIHEPRRDRESRFVSIVHSTVSKGGRLLIPVFALGRAQELLLILDEYWAAHPELESVPIYFASSLGKKCMQVYQTYTNMMNKKIGARALAGNPFVFNFISELTKIDEFNDNRPCVVMASPGMLQNGLSRQLFELWCHSEKNGVLLPGYCVEGTLAKTILSDPDEIETKDGRKVPCNLKVHYISFSAHSDFYGTSTFIDSLSPPNVILVHGEKNEMSRLQQALLTRYADRKMEILTPRNTQTVRLQFRGEKTAKAVGKVAKGGPQHLGLVSGILVQKDYQYTLVDPSDLQTYTKLKVSEITQSLKLPYQGPWKSVIYQIQQIYESIVETQIEDKEAIKIHEVVDLILISESELVMEWTANPVNDMIADSIASIIFQMSSHPASFSAIEQKEKPVLEQERFQLIQKILQSFYGSDCVAADNETKQITIKCDGSVALYHFRSGEIDCNDEALKQTLIEITNHSQSTQPIQL